MKKTTLFLILFLGASTFAASAQTAADRAAIKNTFGFGPRLGYYKANDADEGNFYGGIQARIRFGSVIGIEGSIEYRAGQEYGIANYNVKTSFVPVTASMILFVPISQSFAPYGLAGLGVYYTRYTYSEAASVLGFDDDSNFNIGYHLGFGAEFPFSQNVALNVDYRYLFLNPDKNQESLDGASFDGNVFTAGLTFYF
ncbi:MAG: porin family protein [Rhodothermaceae bacterium]|nr:porin family protein [Rhodothermaceae bacterium]